MNLRRPLPGEYAEGYAPYIAAAGEGDVLALLQGQMGEVAALFAGLSETQGAFRYAPGKWSLKDLLLHLSDAERIFAYRCLRIGRGDATPMPGFEEELVGLSAGQSKQFTLTAPKDYYESSVAGKKVDFAVTMRRISAAVSGTFTPLNTRGLYGSSLITMTSSGSTASSSASSPAEYTAPVGLLGEFRIIAFVRGVIAAAMRDTTG